MRDVNFVVIAALLLLGAFASAQVPARHQLGTRLRQVRFAHVSQLDERELESCAARLQAKDYDPKRLAEEVAERARVLCWQPHGYFRSAVSAVAEEYTPGEYSVVLTVSEGPQYHLGTISFFNVKVVTRAELLRELVPLRIGDVFDSSKIKEATEGLCKAYATIGYLNFTSKLNTEVDDERHIINIDWVVNEGKPFFVRTIRFDGLLSATEDSLRAQLLLKSGSVYNQAWMEKSLDRMRMLLPPRTDLQAEPSTDNELSVVDIRIKQLVVSQGDLRAMEAR